VQVPGDVLASASPQNDRVAVVTGAARGLGRVVAATLAREGHRLVVADLSPLDEAVAEAESAGADVVAINADVSSERDVVSLSAEAVSRFGRVDVLVNNAGVSLLKPAEETSAAD
jgi:NAD(P)-dependent dehydrogenase (short-subunit alcohol dehydrogenase family)